MKTLAILSLAAITLCGCCKTEKAVQDDYLVGIEYFAGWWEDTPNKWQEKDSTDWRTKYPERIPINGQYNSQEVMDKDIKVAAANGVDFFSILWYYDNKAELFIDKINQAVGWFMNSPNAGKMKFMLEITNHPPFGLTTQKQLDAVINLCIKSMAHPSYLRIDGRPVVKIHGGAMFVSDLGGDQDVANEVIAKMKKKISDAGLGDALISVGITEDVPVRGSSLEGLDIDCTMQYMDPTSLPQVAEDYPFPVLAAQAIKDATSRTDDIVPFVPFFPCGWNPKPWFDERANFSMPTRNEWTAALTELKNTLDTQPNLGFPRSDGTIQKAFTIYAWNEYGEGGFMAPTAGAKNMKLEVLNQIFPNSVN